MRVRVAVIGLACLIVPAQTVSIAQSATESQSGAEIYRAACAACHGLDGRGSPRSVVGFDVALPDFTDCGFTSPEADADWIAVVHQGGPVRAFDRLMPAFGAALSDQQIARVVAHLRTFCRERGWPRGDLNLPRPLVTEKAFPENEAVVTSSLSRSGGKSVVNEFLYERRVGKRGQYELAVPIDLHQGDAGHWARGLGDIAAAYKHAVFDSVSRGSIVSVGGEMVFPTGKETEGLGGGKTVFEPFGTLSQALPHDMFVHLHAGLEIPLGASESHTGSFWRATVGKTIFRGRWHRAWSPMFEVLRSREHAPGERAGWDVVPQVQVSLSTRQHVLLNAGLRIPVNKREERGNTLMVYLLWDWFDAGLFTGW
jgi:mono/diheme cytochrome c family protein